MSSCPVDPSIGTSSRRRRVSDGTNSMRSLWALLEVSTTCVTGVTCRLYTSTSSHTTSFLTTTLFQKLLILGSPTKLFQRYDSFVPLSAMRGTIGYIALEMVYRSFGVISSKSNVYRFGMLLLEMVGDRRNVDPQAGSSIQAYYPSFS
jgi:serine/threonine protein kinase